MPSTLTSAGWVVDPEPQKSGGGVTVLPASTTLALDVAGKKLHLPYTVTGPVTINITGTEPGAEAEMVVIGNGTHKPTIVGADPVISNFDFVLQGRNFLNAWHDGDGRRFAWSQLEVNSAPSPSPAPPAPSPSPAPPPPAPSPSPAPAPAGEDAITTAYRAALVAAGITPNETHMTHADTFAKGLRSANLHTKITAINLACQDTLAGSLVSLIGATAAAVGAPTFDPALGWSNATSTSYINTGVTPSTAALGFGAYLRTAQTSDATARCLIGTSSATDVFRICGNRNAAGSASAGAVSALTGGTVNGAATTGGLVAAAYHAIRRSATDEVLLKNGANVGTNAVSTTPGAGTVPIYVYVQNNTSGPTTTSVLATGSRVAGYWVDDGTMTDVEAGTLYTLLQSFQTSMGRQV